MPMTFNDTLKNPNFFSLQKANSVYASPLNVDLPRVTKNTCSMTSTGTIAHLIV